jgi:tRNA(adenine34) deaminase
MSVLTSADRTDQSAIDTAMMQRCIRLSATATENGEFPFAAVICEGDMVVAEATNLVAQNGDVTQHAELVAVSKAQQVLGRKDLSTCTIYSNVEPCVMCSFPIRETRIARVIYAISSPIMGGFSRWNVLRDAEISKVMPEAFGPIPEVIAGLLQRKSEKVWRKWNPLIWGIIKYRGCFGSERDHCQHMRTIQPQQGFLRRLLMQYRNRHSI